MKIARLLLSIVVTAITLVACQKEVDFSNNGGGSGNGGGGGGGTNTNLIGNYKFVAMIATTKSTNISTEAGIELKAITTSGYITKNNVGTVTITSDKFTTIGVGYSIDTTMHADAYLGGVLLTSLDLPFAVTLPPSGGTSTYHKITNDSLYFDAGFVSSGPVGGSSGSTATLPIGSRISWSGDTLIMKTVISQNTTQDVGGVMTQIINEGTQTVKLKRQ